MSDADRIRAFRHALEDRTADRREPLPWGTALHVESLPNVYDLNFLRVESDPPPSTGQLAAVAEEAQAHLFHRKVAADHGGAALARDFDEIGWTPTPHLVMAHRRKPDRAVDTTTVREVPFEEIRPSRERAHPPGLASDLTEAKRRVAAATRLRHFAAFADGQLAAYCELRSDGEIAQIEDVNTLPEFRGRGLGRALVHHVTTLARRGHGLVFLEALADDWPRKLYAKLGFDVVDERWLFLRPQHPLTPLRLRTPRLELRLATRAELRQLAAAGVHTSDLTPPEATPERWELELVAFLGGRPVGVQTIAGEGARIVHTDARLGERWEGQALAAEMRAAAAEIADADVMRGFLRGLTGALP